MRHDGRKIGHGGEDREDADKGIECRLRADVYATEDGDHAPYRELCVERVAPVMGYGAQPLGKRRGVVARQRPQHAAGGSVVGGDGDDEIEDEYDQQARCASSGASSCLQVYSGEGQLIDGRGNHIVKGGDGVEDGDVEYEGGQEAYGELSNDAFGDVDSGLGDFFRDW